MNQLTLDNLISFRIALDQLKEPSAEIIASIAHLDKCISLTILSFQTSAPTQGNA